MKIYTKTGDKGETSLLGGRRVKKNSIEIKTIGDVDELNASLGIIVAYLEDQFFQTREMLMRIQHQLFTIGAKLADIQSNLGHTPQLQEADVLCLEQWIDVMEEGLPVLQQFILPGGHIVAAQIFFARAVCRRVERHLMTLSEKYPMIDPLLQKYLNRLGDALFVLGRWVNNREGITDIPWQKVAS